ncbi:U3 small nucleolar RNA-associated protein 18 homolog [Culicoides brevitarsis]|uniref:U3 small nucleolar RNA-associated protein 18 homolog n=1 Tax=Culicoides brevitarsis TaxID=469753 RepID=UPI00307B5BA2
MDSDLDDIIHDSHPTTSVPVKSEASDDETPEIFIGKERVLKKLEQLTKGPGYEVDRKRPVWHDEDDDTSDDDEETNKTAYKRKKLDKNQRTRELHKLSGEPDWVKGPRDSDSSDDELAQTATKFVEKDSSRLQEGVLVIKRLKDLNRSTYTEKKISSVIFHPTSTVAICTGENGVANIYTVDGKKNEKLHSIAFENFDITCAGLVDGQELIVGGRTKNFFTYDLLSGKSKKILLPKNITKLKKFVISPCGKFIASVGRFGEIHLFSVKSKELIRTFKQEYFCSALAFTADSKSIFCHSISNEVTILDIAGGRISHKWSDDGCINGSTISVTENLVATGSKQGVVNIYDINDVRKTQYPQTKKAILNLTTAITATVFNPSSEILAMCSVDVAEAARMIHFPSLTAFNNFPGQISRFGHPRVMAFSPMGGFFAVGNRNKTVALYRLKHYNNY